MKTGWYPFAIAHSGTLSYLTVRDLPDGGGVEFGTVAYGHRAAEAAANLVSHLRAWDVRGRELRQDAFTYWPGSATPPPDRLLSVFPKRHGTATITWPPAPIGDED
jgi:protein-L-isoaspartate(D-aspartate) O-methyltransferase